MLKFVQETIIFGTTLPAVVAGLFMLAAWRPWSERDPEGFWGAGLGISAGYLAAHYGLGGVPETMPYVVAAIAAVAAVEAFVPVDDFRPWKAPLSLVPWVLRVAAIPLVAYLVAKYMFGSQWTGMQLVLWPASIAVAAGAMIGSLEALARRRPGVSIPIAMILIGTGGALAMALTGTARVGELLGALTATAGALMVVCAWDGRIRVDRGGVTAFVLIFVALTFYGTAGMFDNQGVAAKAVFMLAAAPHLMWLEELPVLRDLDGWRAVAVRVGLTALGVGGTALYVWLVAG